MSTPSGPRVAPVFRQNEDSGMQRMNSLLSEQNAQLTRWSNVAKRIIKEVCSFREEDIQDDVSCEDLAMVLDYLKLMKSSVVMYQDLNEALRSRIDDLLEISIRDGQCLGNIVDHVQSMPVMDILNASSDAQNNQVILNLQFNGEPSIQVRPIDISELSELDEQHQQHNLGLQEIPDQDQGSEVVTRPQPQQKASWMERGLSIIACACLATLVAKSSFFKINRRS